MGEGEEEEKEEEREKEKEVDREQEDSNDYNDRREVGRRAEENNVMVVMILKVIRLRWRKKGEEKWRSEDKDGEIGEWIMGRIYMIMLMLILIIVVVKNFMILLLMIMMVTV